MVKIKKQTIDTVNIKYLKKISLVSLAILIVFVLYKELRYEPEFTVSPRLFPYQKEYSTYHTIQVQFHDFNEDGITDLLYLTQNNTNHLYFLQGLNLEINKPIFTLHLNESNILCFSMIEDINGDESHDMILLIEKEGTIGFKLIDVVKDKVIKNFIPISHHFVIPESGSSKLSLFTQKIILDNSDRFTIFFSLNIDDNNSIFGFLNPETGIERSVSLPENVHFVRYWPEDQTIHLVSSKYEFSDSTLSYTTKICLMSGQLNTPFIKTDSLKINYKANIEILTHEHPLFQYLLVNPENASSGASIFRIQNSAFTPGLLLPGGKILASRIVGRNHKFIMDLIISGEKLMYVSVDLNLLKIVNVQFLTGPVLTAVDKAYFTPQYIWCSKFSTTYIYPIDNPTAEYFKLDLDPLIMQGGFIPLELDNFNTIFIPFPLHNGYYLLHLNTFRTKNLLILVSILIVVLIVFIGSQFLIPGIILAIKVFQYLVIKSGKGLFVLDRDGHIKFHTELISEYLKNESITPFKNNEKILNCLNQDSEIHSVIKNMLSSSTGFIKNIKVEFNQKTADLLLTGEPIYLFGNTVIGYLIEAINVSTLIDSERIDIWTRSFKKTFSLIETPMTNIMINNSALNIQLKEKKRINRPNLLKHVERINQSLDTIKDIRNKLEKVIEIKRINRHVILVENLIQRSLKKFSSFFDSNIDLVLNFDNPLPAIQVDAELLQMALENVIENSIDAMGGKGILQISCSMVQYPIRNFIDALEITITDTGKGLSKEFVPFVFEPYFSTKPFGTGLGLAITRKIIEAHEGEIYFNSTLDVGSTVNIIIPYL